MPTGLEHQKRRADSGRHSGTSNLRPRASRSISRLSYAVPAIAATFLLALDLMLAVILSLDPISDGWLGSVSPFVAPSLGLVGVFGVVFRRRSTTMASLSLTLATVGAFLLGSVMDTNWAPSFAALFALATLTARAIKFEVPAVAIFVTVTAAIGVAFTTVAPMAQNPTVLIYLSEFGLGCAVGLGLYQRWAIWQRNVAEALARNDERLEIARELHDTIGHYVTGIVVQAQAARHIASENPDVATVALERIETAGADALHAMRQVVIGLRDDARTTPGDSWCDIDALLQNASDEGIPLVVRIDPEVRTETGPLASAASRVIAEALTNVRKHGRDVSIVDVTVETNTQTITVIVQDDGTEPGLAGQHTFGLIGMRERAESLGGTLSAGIVPGGGWLVRADLPKQART